MISTTMNTTKSLTFDVDRLETIFPFYFAFNHKLKLIEEGKGLEKLLPSMRIRKKVYAYFSVEEFASKQSDASFFKNIEEGIEVVLFLNFSKVRLKGTFFKEVEAQKTYFLGNPILDSIEEMERLKFKKEEFSVIDTGIDQLFRSHGNSKSSEVLSEDKQGISITNHLLNSKLDNYLNLFQQAIRELSTPIRNNVSYAQILKRQQVLDEDLSHSIHLIEKGSSKAQGLLKGLEEYFKLKNQEQSLELLDVSMVLDSAKNSIQNLLKERNVLIEYRCQSIVNMDFRHLTYILKALIENAIHFNQNQQPEIQLICKKQKDRWMYCVKDNGIGIASKHIKELFEPFKKYNMKLHNGIGLSLTTCKMLVQLYDGNIWVDSTVGKGTSVYFTLKTK